MVTFPDQQKILVAILCSSIGSIFRLSAMSAHITLRSEPGSAPFPERSFELQEGASVRVSRLSRDERPNYNNVIFDSRVRRIEYLRYFLITYIILGTGCFVF